MKQGEYFSEDNNASIQLIKKKQQSEESVKYWQSSLKNDILVEQWINYKEKSLSFLISRSIKRTIDIIGSIIGLILFLPLIIIIALLIKLESSGSVIFSQLRIGQNRRRNINGNGHLHERRINDLKGKPFYIYKFRTMKNGVDKYATSPYNKTDIRLTKIGKIIRSMCLDEIPQLINVIKGDMSLVGPRPEMSFIVKNYGPVEELRLAVKPGLTGLWQLYGSRAKNIHENLQYDLEYIKRRSLMFDLKIILKTIGFMLRYKNV